MAQGGAHEFFLHSLVYPACELVTRVTACEQLLVNVSCLLCANYSPVSVLNVSWRGNKCNSYLDIACTVMKYTMGGGCLSSVVSVSSFINAQGVCA